MSRDVESLDAGERVARRRVVVRTHPDTHERLRYWADAHQMSLNDYLNEALEQKIARENGDYDLPTLEQARLNQLVDGYTALSRDVQNMGLQLNEIMRMFTNTMVGETGYLADDDSGIMEYDQFLPGSVGEAQEGS